MYLSDFAYQNQVLLLSVGFGTLLGLVYDLFRLVRIADRRRRGVFLQDLLFLVVAAFLTVLFLLVVNHGSLRLFILLAMAVGFFAYYFTLSRVVMRCARFLFLLLRRVLIFLARFISTPFRLALRFFAFFQQKVRDTGKNHKKEACKNSDI